MAKKKSEQPTEEERQSRKEILLERKQREQMRSIRIGAAIVLGLIVLVLIVALVNEFFIAPNRAVAIVNGENITLSDWQERVRFERAQRIIGLENQLELLGGNVGQVQQFSGQTIVELQEGQTLGELTLDQMVNEELIRQGAEERGISVTDAEVEARIGSFFNYFGGDVPTPQPTPTQTIMPTPSLTPIPTEVITDVVPTQTPFPTPTIGPTSTPLPTPTPVSEEAYLAELDELVGRFVDLGVSESLYRDLIRTQIYSEKLTDALVDEQDFMGEAPHASLFLLLFNDAEAAEAAEEQIRARDYLTVWNEIRSTPPDPEAPANATASEVLWQTQRTLANRFNAELAEIAFTLPPNVPGAVLGIEGPEGETQYVLPMVSGREIRPLSANEEQARRQEILSLYLDEAFASGDVEITDAWRGRVPVLPVLDPIFLQPPTPVPEQPTAPALPNEDAEQDSE